MIKYIKCSVDILIVSTKNFGVTTHACSQKLFSFLDDGVTNSVEYPEISDFWPMVVSEENPH